MVYEEKFRTEVSALAHSNEVCEIPGGKKVLFSHSQNETTTPAKKKEHNWTKIGNN